MKKIILLTYIIIALFWIETNAQVAINDNGNPADPSAILDLQSTNKGLLIPRINFNNRPDPAAPGLLIFVTENGPRGDNALYIYDGTNWVQLAISNIEIGSFTEGGFIFWLDGTGDHGLISAAADLDSTEWGCFGTLIGPNAQHTEIRTGDTNTTATISGCTDYGIAAYKCDTLTLNGYTDWYLPSRDELMEMYVHRNFIGGFTTARYWASTECSDAQFPQEEAWIVNFNDGSWGWNSKSNTIAVRCIRKF